MDDLAASLTGLPDREIAALLLARPDLLAPPSPSFTALAARAAGRTSTDLALAGLDAAAIAVAEGLVSLAAEQSAPAPSALPAPMTPPPSSPTASPCRSRPSPTASPSSPASP